MAEEVAAQKLPDVFDRVELWRIGWQRQHADIVWHWQTFAGLMPAGTVKHQHGVRARRDLRADFPKMLGHRLAVDHRHDDGGTNTAFRADGTKQIGGIMAVVAHSQWSGTPLCPDIAQGSLLTDTGLIGELHLDRLTGRPGRDRRRYQAGEVFLKMSCAAASLFG